MTEAHWLQVAWYAGVLTLGVILAIIIDRWATRSARRAREQERARRLLQDQARAAAVPRRQAAPVVPPADWQSSLSMNPRLGTRDLPSRTRPRPAVAPSTPAGPPENWQSTLTLAVGSPTWEIPGAFAPGPSAATPTSAPVPAATPAPTPPARPASAVPTLDLATFAPMSDAQVKAAAQGLVASGVNLFQTFRFGLRSQIPPATDPRTLLIDKALVAHGLLTPEDLVEIHRLGDAMDEVKPALETVHASAEHVVRQSIEDKKRLKEQKKAAAAERKRLRAEAVARRRATDIIHLGRGVSKGLADRRADVERLTAADLPLLATPADVAEALGLERVVDFAPGWRCT